VPAEPPRVNILLVDDHPSNLLALEGILEGLGQNLVRANSGAEALKRLLHDDFAVVLMDVQMPDMDGFETAALIRKREQYRNTPIIFVSAIYKTSESIAHGYSVGAVDYITKPLDADALRTKVQAFVQMAQHTKQVEDEVQHRKLAEEEIARLNSELEERVRDRTAELERTLADLRLSDERYRAFLSNSAEAIWRFEMEEPVPVDLPEDEQIKRFYARAYLAECNDALAHMYGLASACEVTGSRLGDLLIESDPANRAYLQAFIRSGYRLTDAESHELDVNGRPRYFLNNLTGVVQNGHLVRAWGTQRDITDQKQQEAAQAFLYEATALLASSLDYSATLQSVARLAVSRLADWCTVDVLREDGTIDRLAVAHTDPAMEPWALDLFRKYPPDPHSAHPVPQILASGQSFLASDITEQDLATVAHDEAHLEILKSLGFRSYMGLPIIARGRTLGVISFVAAESGRMYTPQDVRLAEELVSRSALAVDNARLYQVAQGEIAERAKAYGEIEALNERLQRSMAETHHRVRNNLQIIAALTEVQAVEDSDSVPMDELRRIAGHVRALAAVHDILTDRAKRGETGQGLSPADVLGNLVPLIQQTAGTRRVYCSHVDDVTLPAKQGTALAVVANELLTNAIKYGHGDVQVRFIMANSEAVLEVMDDGPGFGERFDIASSASTGLELVRHICRWDLQGEMRIDNRPEGGARVSVRIPLSAVGLRG
jgi:two-component sensor histidine kinase/CheY-like chemotaxis protein